MEANHISIKERAADYYRGERISNALIFLIGCGAVFWTLSLFLWRQGHLSRGLFIGTFPLAIFFIVSGAYRFIRSMKRFDQIRKEISGDVFLLNEEKEHLIHRLKRFKRKRKVDGIGILLGFLITGLSVVFRWNHLLLGTAISIAGFSAILLIFDLFGQYRTEELLHHLNKIKK